MKMEENLIHLISKLSVEIIEHEFADHEDNKEEKKRDPNFKRYFTKVCQKGFDVLLGRSGNISNADPCQTDYGGNWSPQTLVLDYGAELSRRGASKSNEDLITNVSELQEKSYNNLDDMFKFLLLMKGPYVEQQPVEHEFSFTGSDYFFKPANPFSMVPDDVLSSKTSTKSVQSKSIFKDAMFYHDNWSNNMESGFQLLDKFSEKGLESSSTRSSRSLFSIMTNTEKCTQSSSNFSVSVNEFPYLEDKFYAFKTTENDNLSEFCLLDSFVDKPISHKLPNRMITKAERRTGSISSRSCDRSKEKYRILPELAEEKSSVWDFYEKDIMGCDDVALQSSGVDSKTTFLEAIESLSMKPKPEESFSQLYTKHLKSNHKLNESNSKASQKSKSTKESLNSSEKSKNVILGLWEQECLLIQEFRPELSREWPQLRILELTEYVRDVKYLLTGINTSTFQLDEERSVFYMNYGTCLDGITPESMYNFSEDFLDIGTKYVRLSKAAAANGKNIPSHSRIICQAFWKSVFEFLERHYACILAIPSNINLLALKASTKKLHSMISAVADICKVSMPQSPLPEGGPLLSYLLNAAEKLRKKYVQDIVFGILKTCCDVYLIWLLQTWLFQGHIEGNNSDFFVEHRPERTKIKDRSYYLSFYMHNDKIPCFLKGLEDSILNCGKSVHLLKLFHHEDSFCQILERADYPRMRLCVSTEDLEKFENEFQNYYERVNEFCGPSVSVKMLQQEEKEKEELYEIYVRTMQKQISEKKEIEKRKKIEEIRAKKEEQRRLLNEQIEAAKAEKERKKLEEEAEIKKFEDEIAKMNAQERKILDEERTKMKMYYDDLLNKLEQREQRANWRKQRLLLFEKRLLLFSEEENLELEENLDNNVNSEEGTVNDNIIINDNKNVDDQGNIIENIDLNSNVEGNRKMTKNIIEERLADVENKNIILAEKSGTLLNELATSRENYENVTDTNLMRNIILSEAKKNKMRILGSEYGVFNENFVNKKDGRNESEAEKNKKKILATEYGPTNDTNATGINRKPEMIETEAQKNKRKLLAAEFGTVEMENSNKTDRKQRPESEAERNKKKILSSEFAISDNMQTTIAAKQVNKAEAEKIKEKILRLEYGDEFFESHSPSELKLELNKGDLNQNENLITPDQGLGKSSPESSITTSESFSSFLTASNGNLVDDNYENEDFKQELALKEVDSVPAIKDPSYSDSLNIDFELFQERQSSPSMFSVLRNYEENKLQILSSQVDYTDFKKFLRKSILLPLKIQEKLANEALLKYFLKKENLLSHLNSLRCYFFLNDGEFGRSLTHNIFQTLSKCTEPQQFFERSTLKNIVNEALNYTIHNSEPNAQLLSFKIIDMPPFLNHSSHNVLSPFELSYQVKWPLNIILTEKALSKYKMIFQFLLKLKRISWTLNENFLYLTTWYKDKRVDGKLLINSSHYHKIQIYRHAMAQFIITLEEYFSSNGLQFSWINFLKDLETAENLDHLYQKHVRYVKDVLRRCFLTKHSQELLDCIHNLIELGLKFHYTTKSSLWELIDGKYVHPKFHVIRTTFSDFCNLTREFIRTLRKKILLNHELKSHYVLLEKLDLILKREEQNIF